MFDNLSQVEMEMMKLIIQGQNAQGVMDWLDIDYKSYLQIKKSLFKKLKVTRLTQLISVALLKGIEIDDL